MSNFTPAPWQVNGSHVYGPDPQRELVAQAHGDGEGAWSAIGGSRMVHNRNLIAAAPDMYEGITDAILCLRNYEDIDNDNGPNWAMRMVQGLEAIIAKADGLTQTAKEGK